MTCSTRTSLYCCVVKVFRLHHTRRRAGKLPERPELRVERGLKLARTQVWLRKLHDWVVRVMAERKLDSGGRANEILLQGKKEGKKDGHFPYFQPSSRPG